MSDLRALLGLADAAGHLWRARDELVVARYASWGDQVDDLAGELLALIEGIALETRWLEQRLDAEPRQPRLF